MTKKLRLALDALTVESFAVSSEAGLRGTVRGAADTVDETLCVATCDPSFCIDESCDWTHCNNLSCAGGCDTGGGGGGGADTMYDATCNGGETCTVRCVNPE